MMRYLLILLLICSCTPLSTVPPHLRVVGDRAQIGGKPAVYDKFTQTIYLAPGATEYDFEHELGHHYWGNLGEKPLHLPIINEGGR